MFVVASGFFGVAWLVVLLVVLGRRLGGLGAFRFGLLL